MKLKPLWILPPLIALLACGGSPEPGSADHEASLDVLARTTPTPPPPTPTAPPAPAPVEDAAVDRVLVADLYGDGKPELLVATGTLVQWGEWSDAAVRPTFTGRHSAGGTLQAWFAHDLDGDGKQEVVAAFGMGRGAPKAPLEIVRLGAKGSAVVSTPLWRTTGPRNQAPSLSPWPRADGTFDVYVTAFEDRFQVRGGVLSRKGGEPEWLPNHSVRMGMARAVGDFDGDGVPEVAVGRLYGDDSGEDGDLRVLGPDGRVELVPTLRGVRSVGAGDVDGDGRVELLFGDGWHKNYGKLARYRPSIARRAADGTWTVELVEESDEQYAVEQIGVVGGRLIAGGNRAATVYSREGATWKRTMKQGTTPYGSWAVLPREVLVTGGPKALRGKIAP